MRGADVLQAAAACRELLNPTVEASWDVPVPGLEMTVAQVVAHAAKPASVVLLSGRPVEFREVELVAVPVGGV